VGDFIVLRRKMKHTVVDMIKLIQWSIEDECGTSSLGSHDRILQRDGTPYMWPESEQA
jgi:hypothetical protein